MIFNLRALEQAVRNNDVKEVELLMKQIPDVTWQAPAYVPLMVTSMKCLLNRPQTHSVSITSACMSGLNSAHRAPRRFEKTWEALTVEILGQHLEREMKISNILGDLGRIAEASQSLTSATALQAVAKIWKEKVLSCARKNPEGVCKLVLDIMEGSRNSHLVLKQAAQDIYPDVAHYDNPAGCPSSKEMDKFRDSIPFLGLRL